MSSSAAYSFVSVRTIAPLLIVQERGGRLRPPRFVLGRVREVARNTVLRQEFEDDTMSQKSNLKIVPLRV